MIGYRIENATLRKNFKKYFRMEIENFNYDYRIDDYVF